MEDVFAKVPAKRFKNVTYTFHAASLRPTFIALLGCDWRLEGARGSESADGSRDVEAPPGSCPGLVRSAATRARIDMDIFETPSFCRHYPAGVVG